MSAFESIFSSKTNVDSNLNALFSRKVPVVEQPAPTSAAETESTQQEAATSSQIADSTKKKKFKRDAEQEARTIFVGNIAIGCKKEELLKVFKTFGKIDSIRFRNIVPDDLSKTKKFAYITKNQHPNKVNCNAFIRFVDKESAKRAAKEANEMEFKGNHIRVDLASYGKAHDNKRSIFLGNLPFDITEESIYNHFKDCGQIENVRVIRDNKTGIGKGFGYVQFKTADSVALGVKLNNTTLCERAIRVTRCVKKQKPTKEDKQHKQRQKSGGSGGKFQKKGPMQTKFNDKDKPRKKFNNKKFDSKQTSEKGPSTSKKPKKASTNNNNKKKTAFRKQRKQKRITTNTKNKTNIKL